MPPMWGEDVERRFLSSSTKSTEKEERQDIVI
jgi:hypothetical protein